MKNQYNYDSGMPCPSPSRCDAKPPLALSRSYHIYSKTKLPARGGALLVIRTSGSWVLLLPFGVGVETICIWVVRDRELGDGAVFGINRTFDVYYSPGRISPQDRSLIYYMFEKVGCRSGIVGRVLV